MKTLIKNILSLVIFCGTFSSCNYLDVVPDNVATIEYAFRNRASCEKFLFTCYSYLPKHGDITYDPAMVSTDEGWFVTSPYLEGPGRNIARGEQNVSDPYMNAWSGTDGLPALWDGIRDCNIFLENVDLVYDLTPTEKKKWIAEVKFLKAYFHFYLFRMYGPIPIMDQNIPISASPDEVKVYREPVDEVIDYIAGLMDEAAQDLPEEREVIEGTEAGHINNLIAKSMRAKVLVYGASSLFNGNTDYVLLQDKRGKQLFPQSYDGEKWKRAADACKEAIDMCHAQGKNLYTNVDPQLTNVNDTFKIQTTYRQAICDRWNCELIWGGLNYDCNRLQKLSEARIVRMSGEQQTVVRTEWGPTLKMVEQYYTSNGVPMDEDKEWLSNKWYENRYNIRPEVSSGKEKFYVKEGEKTVYLHYNREPRFYASIGFDKGIYFGNGYVKFPEDVKYADFVKGGVSAGVSMSDMVSITGYCPKKMHSYKNAQTQNSASFEFYPFPIMRLADLYLLYAEALNEYSGPNKEVFHYLDLVRQRANLEGVEDSWRKYSTSPGKPSSQDGLREIIRNERAIELAFEGEYFWDLRRWKQIQKLNEQPMGWNVNADTPESFYTKTTVSPVYVEFSTRDYFWPIQEKELTVNTNLIQNFDW